MRGSGVEVAADAALGEGAGVRAKRGAAAGGVAGEVAAGVAHFLDCWHPADGGPALGGEVPADVVVVVGEGMTSARERSKEPQRGSSVAWSSQYPPATVAR